MSRRRSGNLEAKSVNKEPHRYIDGVLYYGFKPLVLISEVPKVSESMFVEPRFFKPSKLGVDAIDGEQIEHR